VKEPEGRVARRRTRRLATSLLTIAGTMAHSTLAGEAEISRALKGFFATGEESERERRIETIEADPAYDRSRIPEWLRGLVLHTAMKPGRHDLRVPVGLGQVREVTLRLPGGYTPARAWPLVYALHPSGSNGPAFLSFVEHLLGDRVNEFVIVAPSHYRQTGLDAPPPFSNDHAATLREIRARVHIDAGRQYAIGYSLGGYATWAIAYLHGEELAGAIPIASVLSVPPAEDGLWKLVLPNLARVPILSFWGAEDSMPVPAVGGRPAGTIAALNRRFVEGIRGMGLDIQHREIPGQGHNDTIPPAESVQRILSRRRPADPRRIAHTFRHLHQGRAYWLEAHSWEGEHWGGQKPVAERRPGETPTQALGRAIAGVLGYLGGEIRGQTVRVRSRHVAELTVWLGEDSVDWACPVRLEWQGRVVFEGTIEPSLEVCLSQADRTRDFDRLRWAGLRVGPGARVEPVTAHTEFPPLLPGE
jgi:pimeloyl-ACP methyl ester carboxylesterase